METTTATRKVRKITDYSCFICPVSARRKPVLTRELTKQVYSLTKTGISLALGMPNESTFPFEKIDLTMKDGTKITLEDTILNTALQYNPTPGYPPLIKILKEFTYQIHRPPNWDHTELVVVNGSQEGISKTIEMCRQDGQPILVQNPVYMGVEIIVSPHKTTVLPVDQDEFGMIPSLLQQQLENWKTKCLQDHTLKMPKLVYLNPTGSNPSGTTMTLERKRKIYKICSKYNLLILEDDPCFFMHYLERLTPSFLSIDTEGRVIRLDSFSKVLSSGMRVGWVTGPKPLVERLEYHMQSSSIHSSIISQAIISSLIETWGFARLLQHFHEVADFYKARRDIVIAAMEMYLKDLCEWTVPTGGIFVWIKVIGVPDVYDMLMKRGVEKSIVFVPGHGFMAHSTAACSYIRAAFSKVPLNQIETAFKLLAELIREEKIFLQKKLENCM